MTQPSQDIRYHAIPPPFLFLPSFARQHTQPARSTGNLSQAAGLRGALLAQYEDLDPDNLRLELHRINILLTRIEEAREASDALAAAAAAAGGGGADGDSAGVNAVAQADPESGADLASGAGGEGEVQAGVAGDGSPKETGGGVTEAGGAAKSSPDGGDVGEQAAAAAAAAAAGAGAGADTNGTDREASTVSVVVSAAKDENGNSGAGGSGNQGEASAVAGGSGGGNGGGDGGGGGETVPNETDPVAAFWAALAAAESAPTEGSGDDGEADQEEEDAQRKQQQQRLEEEEEVDGAWGGAGDSPLAKGRTYESLSVPMRVAILNALCEEYMDDENFRLRIIVSGFVRSKEREGGPSSMGRGRLRVASSLLFFFRLLNSAVLLSCWRVGGGGVVLPLVVSLVSRRVLNLGEK